MKKRNCLLFVAFLFIFSCSHRQPRPRIQQQTLPQQTAQQVKTERIKAPWEIWTEDTLGDPGLAQAQVDTLNNSFEQACSLYQQIIRASQNPNIQDQARIRLIGTLLKIGKSQEALQEVSRYTKELNIAPQDLRPDFALFAAWAYVNQNQPDQSLAWFRVANQVVDKDSEVALGASKGIRSLLKSLTSSQLETVNQKWGSDGLISKYLKEERLRRVQEGANNSYSLSKFFQAGFYRGSSIVESDLITQNPTADSQDLGTISIGVLLPLTGKFAEHAIKVKEGIELAAGQIELKFGDTQGDPLVAVSEYERLVLQEKVDVVLGPLLVATSEAVGEKSSSMNVPIISFTKREGLPNIGANVFRLGATASNQVAELIDYTSNHLNINSYAIIYPSNENSADYVSEFEKAVGSKGGTIVGREIYSAGDPESAKFAVEKIIPAQPQAIFLPDNLESSFTVLEQIRAQGLNNVKILGPALWSDQVVIRGYGQLLEGAVFVSLFNAHSQDPSIASFISSYRARYKHDPDLLAAQSYDATNFVVTALQNGTGNAQQRISSSKPYLGVTGELNVQADREIARKISVMNVIKGDALEVQFAGQPRGVMPTAAQ